MTNLKTIEQTIKSFAVYFDGKTISDEKAKNGAKRIHDALQQKNDWCDDAERYKKFSTTFVVNLMEEFFPKNREFSKEKYVDSIKKEVLKAKGIYDVSYLNIKDKDISDMLQEYLNDYATALKWDGKGQAKSILRSAEAMLNSFAKYHDLGSNLTAIVDGHYAF